MVLEERDFPTIPGDQMPESVARELQHQIHRYVGGRMKSFPGSQPVSFEARHIIENLERRDYFVCEKSDGLRCLMFCILDPDGNEAVMLITRENQFFRVPNFHFPLEGDDINSCHNGTLIDGELVISKRPTDGVKELRYLMFDCLALNGQNLTSKPLHKRLGYLDMKFYRPYFKLREQHPRECEAFPFKLSLKNMHLSYQVAKLFDNLKYLGHISDGLIFTCCETPYIVGADPTLLKWKPSEENTVDFRLHLDIPTFIDEDLDERDPDRNYPNYEVQPRLELHVWQGETRGVDEYSYFADLKCDPEEWEQLKSLNEPLEQRVVECNKDKDGQWRLLRFRDDKANGNHVSIVKKVLQSIKDAVTKEDLIAAAPEIEQKWKHREAERKMRRDPNYIPPLEQKKRPAEGNGDMPTYADGDSDSAGEENKKGSESSDEDDEEEDDGKVTKKPRME